MAIAEGLLQELEMEAATTRRILARVPDDRLGWKPHPRSFSLGQLAMHIAQVPGAIAELSTRSPCPVPTFVQASATTASELLPALEQSLATVRTVLTGADDAALMTMWRVVDGEREVMAMPRAALLRAIMLNHWYHHRGQLCVDLRQLDVPVPSIYGPTADENPFSA